MIHDFPLNFVKQALEQTLLKKHIENLNYFGGRNQIELFTFFEQLKNQDEVDRFVERYRDLTEQQNRTGLIGNGILLSPENPTITNLYSSLIIPMTFTCSIRTMLENRDQMIDTLFELINELKGRKVDIAELKCIDENGHYYYKPFCVGTIGHNDNAPAIVSGDYIGDMGSDNPTNADFSAKLNSYVNKGLLNNLRNGDYAYFKGVDELKVIYVADQELEIADSSIDQVYYDGIGNDKTVVNGTDYFTLDGTFNFVPSIASFVMRFYVTDGVDHTQTFDVEMIPYDIERDINGVVTFKADFQFTITTSEWDFQNIDSGEDGPVTNPYELDYAVITDDGTYDNVIFPPEHESFDKYKLSMSFDSLRCDTPKTLNGKEYCELSFGGSATLVNKGVKLGNDLVKISMKKYKILAQTPITPTDTTVYYLEPLEMPSGNGANTIPNQLVSNAFKVNSHTDSLTITLQYTFIADDDNTLLSQLFDYGRYGTLDNNAISPNTIFNMVEWWSSWGVVGKQTYLGKLIESVDIENTESDTLTLSITMQVQGENN